MTYRQEDTRGSSRHFVAPHYLTTSSYEGEGTPSLKGGRATRVAGKTASASIGPFFS